MKILAIETSELAGSVAIWQDGNLVYDAVLPSQQRSAQSLAPAIAAGLRAVSLSSSEMDGIAVTMGPGSFTGLRVGVMTAKMFAFATGIPVAGVDTLCTLAVGCSTPDMVGKTVAVAVDAQRNEVVAKRFRIESAASMWKNGENPVVKELEREVLIPFTEWLRTEADVFVSPLFAKESFAKTLPSALPIAPPGCWHPTAVSVGLIALNPSTCWLPPAALNPRYSRLSAAQERKVMVTL